MSGEEDDYAFEIYDDEKGGIILELPLYQTGASIRFYMTDEAAQQMVDIIQNKLNARF